MPSLQRISSKRQKHGRGSAPKSLWQKQVTLADGRRTTIRLGPLSEKHAHTISAHIDHLIDVRKHGTKVDPATEGWLQDADQKLVAKLAKLRLCSELQNPMIVECMTQYILRNKVDWVDGTVNKFEQVEGLLKAFFADRRVAELTGADAKDFWAWMRSTRKLAENTAKKHFQRTRQVLDDAIEREAILRNPFRIKDIKVTVGVADKEYVEEHVINAVIAYLPTDKLEWKLLFAFARFAGPRVPSEIRELTWQDVDWANNTIMLKSPKTVRYGKKQRRIPIFPEIAGLLGQQFEAVQEGEEFVFPTLRKHSNLATTAKKFVEAAGFDTWAEFFNSLRASRETDLMDSYGLRRACAWIGNSVKVAMQHYALLKDSDYIDVGGHSPKSKSDAESDAEQARIAANSGTAKDADRAKRTVCAIGGSDQHPRQGSNL